MLTVRFGSHFEGPPDGLVRFAEADHVVKMPTGTRLWDAGARAALRARLGELAAELLELAARADADAPTPEPWPAALAQLEAFWEQRATATATATATAPAAGTAPEAGATEPAEAARVVVDF